MVVVLLVLRMLLCVWYAQIRVVVCRSIDSVNLQLCSSICDGGGGAMVFVEGVGACSRHHLCW